MILERYGLVDDTGRLVGVQSQSFLGKHKLSDEPVRLQFYELQMPQYSDNIWLVKDEWKAKMTAEHKDSVDRGYDCPKNYAHGLKVAKVTIHVEVQT